MQDCPHDRQEEAQTVVYGTSLQNLLQAGNKFTMLSGLEHPSHNS